MVRPSRRTVSAHPPTSVGAGAQIHGECCFVVAAQRRRQAGEKCRGRASLDDGRTSGHPVGATTRTKVVGAHIPKLGTDHDRANAAVLMLPVALAMSLRIRMLTMVQVSLMALSSDDDGIGWRTRGIRLPLLSQVSPPPLLRASPTRTPLPAVSAAKLGGV